MPQQPDNLAQKLRAAVLASDHEKAARVTLEYTEAVRQQWTSLTPEQRRASLLPGQSIELLTWVREMTLMQQAIVSDHLAAVEMASRYQNARAVYLRSAAVDTQR